MTKKANLSQGIRTSRSAAEGFSIIEVLIAAGLMLIVALGILPLFTRAMMDNTSGNDYSNLANHARSRLEELYQLPFDSPGLTLTSGTFLEVREYFATASERWVVFTAPNPPEGAKWLRTSTIRQYSASAIDGDGQLDSSAEALDASAAPTLVHVKEIEVFVRSANFAASTPLTTGKRMTARVLKSF